MSFNTFGKIFRFTTWGESHGPAIGCIVDGCPQILPYLRKIFKKIWTEGVLEIRSLYHREKSLIKLKFYQEYFKVKQLVPRSH